MSEVEGSLDKLATALVALQADLKPVSKTAANPFFKSKYAPLPEVREALQPLLEKHKLALVSVPAIVNGVNGLRFYLLHESGQHITGEWSLNPVKDDPQGVGSAVTYLRRYGDMAMTGIVADEDDDGNAASSTAKSNFGGQPKEASQKQLDFIASLAEQKGKDEEWLKKVKSAIHTNADASKVIEQLQALEDV